MNLPENTPPLLLIRLSPTWQKEIEEIEPGYYRAGHGWREGMTSTELRDSTRAWWKLDLHRLERSNVDHVVTVVGGIARALYQIETIIGPRPIDGRVAFELSEVEGDPLSETVVGATIEFARGAANPIRYWPSRT